MKTAQNMRMTMQRRVILEEVRKLSTHPTADELYSIVRLKMPHISLGTVYRNLDLLYREGTIDKLELAGFQSRYDGNRAPHYHLRCQVCNQVEDVEVEIPASLGTDIKEKSTFHVTGFRLEFTGICPGCQRYSEGEDSQS